MAKPKLAADYTADQRSLARRTCLYVATKLGDLLPDLRIVGGLVPSLLIPTDDLPSGESAHIGTLDLDLGLALTLLDDERYKSVSERLRDAGFEPDVTEQGRRTLQRWKMKDLGVTVDFLIPPTSKEDQGGKLRNLQNDFAAFMTPGLHLAFLDFERVLIEDETLLGERAAREVWVCGPGAFVVLKALAFRSRGEEKDAYDLFYVIRNFGDGVEDVYRRLAPLLEDPNAQRALEILQQDFSTDDAVGPMRVARFLTGQADDEIQADVVGFVSALLTQRTPAGRG